MVKAVMGTVRMTVTAQGAVTTAASEVVAAAQGCLSAPPHPGVGTCSGVELT
jgi:hypothetical protein